MVTQLWCGREGIVSHRGAGGWYHLDGVPKNVVEVIARQRWGAPPPPGVIVHYTRRLDPEDVREAGPLRITSSERTLIDLGAVLTRHRLRLAFDDVLRKDLSDPAKIAGRLRELGMNGRRNARLLLYLALEATPDQGKQEKGLERRFFRMLKSWGSLPLPTPQFRIYDHIGFIARCDAAWPERRIAIELDSRREHRDLEPFELDRSKSNRLQIAGWIVLRYTYKRLKDPEGVFAELESVYLNRPIIPFG